MRFRIRRPLGQVKLLSIVSTKIDAVRNTFSDEVGKDNIDKFHALFHTAKDNLISRNLNDIIPVNIRYDTTNGITTAYAFMVLDPQIIIGSFPSDSEALRHIYTRFQASTAFTQMSKELKQYEIWKKESGSTFFR